MSPGQGEEAAPCWPPGVCLRGQEFDLPTTERFGPYMLFEQRPGHLVITRTDGKPTEPDWYEMQTMARIVWGEDALVIEAFPPGPRPADVQRHLWLVDDRLSDTPEGMYWMDRRRGELPQLGRAIEDIQLPVQAGGRVKSLR